VSGYETLTVEQLRRLRDSYPDTSPMQDVLAPYEHQAFAREWTQDNPLIAAPALAVSIPGYGLAKLLGLQRGRTAPSWAEVRGGYRGIGQGLLAALQGQP
jgi:hypothetical protein